MDIDIDTGLVGFWRFDDKASPTIEDQSGWGNHGELHDIDSSNFKTGVSGKCLEFNGVDEYVNCGRRNSLVIPGNFTISFWMLPLDLTDWDRAIQRANSDGYGFSCRFHNQKVIFQIKTYSSTFNAMFHENMVVGHWYHVMVAYDGMNQPNIYVNNVRGTESLDDNASDCGGKNLEFGRRCGCNDTYFHGILDEIRIYNRFLNEDERVYLYNNPSGEINILLDRDLACYLPLNEGVGSIVSDDSGYGNDGTLMYMADSNWKDGVSGKSLEFVDNVDMIQCGGDDSLKLSQTGWSVSMWISPKSAGGIRNVMYNAGLNEWVIVLDHGNIILQQLHSPYSEISSYVDNIQNNTWNHVIITSHGYEKKIYINKILVKTGELSIVDAIYCRISYAFSGANCFRGKIDEIRIYNRCLDSNEIEFLYLNPSGTQKSLVSARLLITDLDGMPHSITENIETLELNTALSYSTDTFDIILTNYDGVYSFIESDCKIEIKLGVGGVNTKKLSGIITDVAYVLNDDLTISRVEITGEDTTYMLHKIYVFNVIHDKEISLILKEILNTVDQTTGKTIRELANIDLSDEYIYSTLHSSKSTIYAWTPLSTAINELAKYAGYEWYIDIDRKIHFYKSTDIIIAMNIFENDIIDDFRIETYNKAINRSMVFGEYTDKDDQFGLPTTKIMVVTDTISFEGLFIPTSNLLSSISVWASQGYQSDSNLVLTIRDGFGKTISNSLVSAYKDDIGYGYHKFVFPIFVNLVVGMKYYIHMEGTTPDGAIVGYGENSLDENILDYITRFPVRVAHVVNNMESYNRHGLYTEIYVDKHIIDPNIAALKCMSMQNPEPKKSVSLSIKNSLLRVGDIVSLDVTKAGLKIKKHMKIINMKYILNKCFVKNKLELEEI